MESGPGGDRGGSHFGEEGAAVAGWGGSWGRLGLCGEWGVWVFKWWGGEGLVCFKPIFLLVVFAWLFFIFSRIAFTNENIRHFHGEEDFDTTPAAAVVTDIESSPAKL